MVDEEHESGSFPTNERKERGPHNEAAPNRSQHKVIADIHSGMVLVAPVGTRLEEENDAAALVQDDERPPES